MSIWLADLTYTQQSIAADVMPAAIGRLAAYALTHVPNCHPIRLFKYPETLIEALATDHPDLIGFSNYCWNESLSLECARIIKGRWPETKIVFGGPNYPSTESERMVWHHRNPHVTAYLPHEAEVSFAELLKRFLTNGSCYAWPVPRMKSLEQCPSPYTMGLLDEFFDGKLMPIVQTTRGCPFGCTFCVEGEGWYDKIARQSQQQINDELIYIAKKMADTQRFGGRNDLFIADSNFGMFQNDRATCETLALCKHDYRWPDYIHVATGKNQKARVLDAAALLQGGLRLSGSVQTLHKPSLIAIQRENIDEQGLMDLALSANSIGANSYSEIILGLPLETKASHFKTLQTVLDAGFTNVYCFQLMLLTGTELASQETRTQYGFQTRFRVLPRCVGTYPMLGQTMKTAEIEEIVVATDTLSYADYLDCRKMHLLIAVFYNDGLFRDTLAWVKASGQSVWEWLCALERTPPPLRVQDWLRDFEHATEHELWTSREALHRAIQGPRLVDQLLAGELGYNLLFVYKALAWRDLVHDLRAWIETVSPFIPKPVLWGDCSRLSTLFLSEEYTRYSILYGSSLVGLARTLTKLHVSKILSHNERMANA